MDAAHPTVIFLSDISLGIRFSRYGQPSAGLQDAPANGLKWTRTTDLTLIRRAL